MADLLAEIERRWTAMFSALADGRDIAPATRLRTEGLMEAAVLLQLAEPEALLRSMEDIYATVCGCALEESLGESWRTIYQFPQIPAVGRRAPVYPTTRD